MVTLDAFCLQILLVLRKIIWLIMTLNSWDCIAFSILNLAGLGLDEADLHVFKIVNWIIVLQKLRTQDPVLLALLASHTRELPRRDEELESLARVVVFHVGRRRQFNFLSLSSFAQLKIKLDLCECTIRWWIVFAFACPQRNALLAFKTVRLQCFHQLYKRFFWSHILTHTIIKYYLLSAICNFKLAKAHFFCIGRPVLSVGWLIRPDYFSVLFGIFVEIVAAKLDVCMGLAIAREVDAEHRVELFLKVRVPF